MTEITVVDVIRSMQIEPTPALTWMVGARVRELYYERMGVLPPKELRTKTAGIGSHCFAIYPAVMRENIEAIVRECETEAARQIDMGF